MHHESTPMFTKLLATIHVLLISIAALAPHAVADSVVPGNFANSEAPQNNRFPVFVDGGIRYQQVHDSSEFQFNGPRLITELAFRGDAQGAGGALAPITVNDFTISLSTTQNGPDLLNNLFASNLGSDNTVVFSGSATFESDGFINPNGTANFDFRFVFDTPFLYDPSQGHLLLDVLNADTNNDDIGYFFDATDLDPTDGVSRLFSGEGDFNSEVGSSDSVGTVIQFVTAVPEPNTTVLFAVVAFVAARRRNRK